MAFIQQKDLGYDSGENDHFVESYTMPSTGNVQNKNNFTIRPNGNIVINSGEKPYTGYYDGAPSKVPLTDWWSQTNSVLNYDQKLMKIYNGFLYIAGPFHQVPGSNEYGHIQVFNLMMNDGFETKNSTSVQTKRRTAEGGGFSNDQGISLRTATGQSASLNFGSQFAIAHNRLFVVFDGSKSLACMDLADWADTLGAEDNCVLWAKRYFLEEWSTSGYPSQVQADISSVDAGDGRVVVGGVSWGDRVLRNNGIGAFGILNLDGYLLRKVENRPKDESGTGFNMPIPGLRDYSRIGQRVKIGCGRIVVSVDIDSTWSDTTNNANPKAYIFDLNGNYKTYINSYTPYGPIEHDVDAGIAIGHSMIALSFPATKRTRDKDPLDPDPYNSGLVQLYDMNGNYLKTISPPDESNGLDNNASFGSSILIEDNRLFVADMEWGDNGGGYGNALGKIYIYDLYTGDLLAEISGDGNDDSYFGSSIAAGDGIWAQNGNSTSYTDINIDFNYFDYNAIVGTDAVTDLLNKY